MSGMPNIGLGGLGSLYRAYDNIMGSSSYFGSNASRQVEMMQRAMMNQVNRPLKSALEMWKEEFERQQSEYRQDQEHSASRRTRIAGYILGGMSAALLIEAFLAYFLP